MESDGCWVLLVALLCPELAVAQIGVIDFQIVDSESKEQIAARIHLWDSKGKVIRPPVLPFWHDHFVCNGKVRLRVPPG